MNFDNYEETREIDKNDENENERLVQSTTPLMDFITPITTVKTVKTVKSAKPVKTMKPVKAVKCQKPVKSMKSIKSPKSVNKKTDTTASFESQPCVVSDTQDTHCAQNSKAKTSGKLRKKNKHTSDVVHVSREEALSRIEGVNDVSALTSSVQFLQLVDEDEEGEGGGNRRRRQAQAGKIICLFARSLCWRCRMDAELLSAHVVASYNEIL